MARQSTSPVQFNRTVRKDTSVTMTSGRAGVVQPLGYFPLFPGDSAAGRVAFDMQLKEMPKPLLNGVMARFQAWFVPKSAHPQFPGRDELMHAMTGEQIKSLGANDRDPPPFFSVLEGGAVTTAAASDFFKRLGLHVPSGEKINTDLMDAFSVIYNFRLAAHSSRLERRKYATEDLAEATTLPPAFWPSSRLSRVVPDYERALIVGALDLDVASGQVPITGSGAIKLKDGPLKPTKAWYRDHDNSLIASNVHLVGKGSDSQAPNPDRGHLRVQQGGTAPYYLDNDTSVTLDPDGGLVVDLDNMFADMGGHSIGITLADIDKARTTQAFAKLRTAYAGNDATGFDNDDTIVALLMQGIVVPPDQFKRPWLLDNRIVPVGFAERFATDAANLEQSVTRGRVSAQLSLNVPMQDVGGIVMFTVELLPERIDERMSDEWLHATRFEDLPNALRDVQRVEPVDLVSNRRIDAKHASPDGLYGYEPMNDKWNRDFTRLGGDFYMATPGGGWTENRSTIWQTEIVDPTFSETHFLAPAPFPHDVFADQDADAYEIVCRHLVTISGNTQIGDVLAENNDDYDAVVGAGLAVD